MLVRDAHADNEFGVAPERVVQDVHDPSANSDLDRIVVDQLVGWLTENRGCLGNRSGELLGERRHGHDRRSEVRELRRQRRSRITRCPPRRIGFEITEKSCVEQVRDVDLFVQACEKLGCHVVLDDFTMHHNTLRWLGSSALKFLKLDPKITAWR